MLSSLFHLVLYKPILNAFVFLYNVIPGHDAGVAILLLTLLVRLVLYPLTNSSIRAQKSLQDMQPKLDEIKKQFPGDKQKQAQATMELYRTHKINPLASCLPTLVQLPVLIALFLVLRDGLGSSNIVANLYTFIANPGTIGTISFGFLDLAKPNVVLAVLAGAAQFWQAKSMIRKSPPKEAGAGGKDENMAAMMNKQMLYMMPLLTVFIGLRFPAGLTLYWFFSTLLMVAQQYLIIKLSKKEAKISPTTDQKVIEGKIIEDSSKK